MIIEYQNGFDHFFLQNTKYRLKSHNKNALVGFWQSSLKIAKLKSCQNSRKLVHFK